MIEEQLSGKELVEELCSFGLSRNEARVYTCITKFNYTNVKEISGKTSIHSQDVYKILAKLEKKGLILKTIDKPIVIKQIPVKLGLSRLLLLKKQDLKKKITALEDSYREVVMEIRNDSETLKENNAEFVLLDYEKLFNMAFNMAELSFKRLRLEYAVVLPDAPFEWLEYLEEKFRNLAKRKIKIRVLILLTEKESILVDGFKRIMPKNADFELKTLEHASKHFFAIYDSEEVWVPILSIDNKVAIVTTATEMSAIIKETFERLWKDPDAKTIVHT